MRRSFQNPEGTMSTERTYKLKTTAILSSRQTSAAYASAILENGGQGTFEKGYLKSGNVANAILQGLCVSVDKIAPRLSEGDRLEIDINQQISKMFPRIASYHNIQMRSEMLASDDLIEAFRAKIRALHLRGVDTSLTEAEATADNTWSTLRNHCEMTLAMAA
jgi:hypothetical protein